MILIGFSSAAYDEAETEYLDGVTLKSVTFLQKMREGASMLENVIAFT